VDSHTRKTKQNRVGGCDWKCWRSLCVSCVPSHKFRWYVLQQGQKYTESLRTVWVSTSIKPDSVRAIQATVLGPSQVNLDTWILNS